MKRIALLALMALVAAAPASAAPKKAKKAPPVAASTNPNENSYRLVRDALPVFLPSWTIPIYLKAKEADAAPKAKRRHARRH
jgi:hypothetical protein